MLGQQPAFLAVNFQALLYGGFGAGHCCKNSSSMRDRERERERDSMRDRERERETCQVFGMNMCVCVVVIHIATNRKKKPNLKNTYSKWILIKNIYIYTTDWTTKLAGHLAGQLAGWAVF